MFAILEQRTAGYPHWVSRHGPYSSSFGSANNNLLPSEYYPERANAERDAPWFRARNAREVDATKRKRRHKTHPATYTVVEVADVSAGERAVDLQADYAALPA